MNVAVIIPSLNPDETLLTVVKELVGLNFLNILIVDDGSQSDCQPIFDILQNQYGCIIYRHTINQGKGASLKSGIKQAAKIWPECVGFITADDDGQHAPKDILLVAKALQNNLSSIILGTRNFKQSDIPFKSKWGNRITSAIFRLSTGVSSSDTQTGLRGIPKKLADFCLSVPGDRFEYEMNMLLELARSGVSFVSVPISTIYFNQNNATHFHTVFDSVRIYYNILKFALSSLASAVLDLSLFTILSLLLFGKSPFGLLRATVSARLCSGFFNFFVNKKWVFQNNTRTQIQAVKYFILFCSQMLLSWLAVSTLSVLPINITVIKLVVDGVLFVLSYQIQNRFIFIKQKKGVPLG